MKWEHVARRWTEAQVDVRARWPRLTDDDLEGIHGDKDALVERIEVRYCVVEEEALEQINAWLERRSPPAELRPYRIAVAAGIALAGSFAGVVVLPLPWGPWAWVGFVVMSLGLMAILFRRWRRLEF